jgi:hypothetical protein
LTDFSKGFHFVIKCMLLSIIFSTPIHEPPCRCYLSRFIFSNMILVFINDASVIFSVFFFFFFDMSTQEGEEGVIFSVENQ